VITWHGVQAGPSKWYTACVLQEVRMEISVTFSSLKFYESMSEPRVPHETKWQYEVFWGKLTYGWCIVLLLYFRRVSRYITHKKKLSHLWHSNFFQTEDQEVYIITNTSRLQMRKGFETTGGYIFCSNIWTKIVWQGCIGRWNFICSRTRLKKMKICNSREVD